jgi:predicted nicotinamide N-methyase
LPHGRPRLAADRDDRDPAAFIRCNTKLIAAAGAETQAAPGRGAPIWQKTEEELGRINVPPPFWAFAWAGGQALARYLLDNPALVRGKSVLDLGSGSGLTAIAPLLAGARSALAADIDPLALAAAELNAAANRVVIATTPDNLLAQVPAAFDVTWSATCSTAAPGGRARYIEVYDRRSAIRSATRSGHPRGRFTR